MNGLPALNLQFSGLNPLAAPLHKTVNSPLHFGRESDASPPDTFNKNETAPPGRQFTITGPNTKRTVKMAEWWPVGTDPLKRPQEAPVILMVHALSGRSEWMTPLVNRMMKQFPGYRFYGIDIPYLGKHKYEEGHIPSANDPVDKVREATEYLATKHGQSVYTIGLSLGGLLVTMAATQPHPQLAGVVALSPGYLPSDRVLNKRVVTSGVKQTVLRSLGLGRFATKGKGGLDFKMMEKPKPPAADAPKAAPLFKTNLQRAIIREKSSHLEQVSGLTPSSYTKIFKLMMSLYVKDARKVKTPYRLYLAENDTIINPNWAKDKIFPKIGAKDKHMTIYQDSLHDFNTHPDIDKIAASVNQFVAGRENERAAEALRSNVKPSLNPVQKFMNLFKKKANACAY